MIPEGTTVVIDSAAALGGYVSDCTRTFATGELPDELARAYDVTKRAQQAGLDAVRPGVTGREADTAARDVVEEAGWGGEFGHGLGHGLGMLVHEAPRLSQESEDTLQAGNVVNAGDLPAGPWRDPDRGPRHRPRRRAGDPHDVHEGSRRRWLTAPPACERCAGS